MGVACLWLACRTHRTRGSLSTERALKIYLTFCLSVFLSICLFVFVSLSLFVFLYTGILKFTWQAIFHLSGSVTLNIILRTPIFLVAIYKEKMTIDNKNRQKITLDIHDGTHTDVVYCKQESAEWCNQLAQVLIVTKRKTARRWWGFPAYYQITKFWWHHPSNKLLPLEACLWKHVLGSSTIVMIQTWWYKAKYKWRLSITSSAGSTRAKHNSNYQYWAVI